MKYRIKTIDKIAPLGLRLLTNHEIGAHVKDPQAIVVRSSKIDIDQYDSLLAIARAGIGVDNIPVEEATQKGICVFNAPGSNSNAVAELVIAQLFSYARNIPGASSFVRCIPTNDNEELASRIEQSKAQFTGFELRGRVLGVVGLGNIGGLVANLGASIGMRVLGYDPHVTPRNMLKVDPRVEYADHIRELLEQSDAITIHVPRLDNTRGMIGANEIAHMKQGCILMNYARQGICDDEAVLEGLNAEKVGAYITDFPTVKLLRHSRVIPSPHLGASTKDSQDKCSEIACRQTANYLDYGIIENSVNFPAITKRPERDIKNRLIIVNRNVPGVIKRYTETIGTLNIESQLNERSLDTKAAYNILDFRIPVPNEVVEAIQSIEGVLHVRLLSF